MGKKSNPFRFIRDVNAEKCPHCNEGQVFKLKTGILKFPVMNDKCPNCDYKFEREPGYFIGAMYLSYGLAVAQGVAAFVLTALILPTLSIEWVITLVVGTIFIFAKKNYKWSRILYIHIFPW
ncbi:MAG: hypothetical protein ACJA0U_000164 [Salibacteraceae bacterium]|jgi:uncharacterized protein (DUF983 family)